MNRKDILIAICIIFIWGANFLVMQTALKDFSPMVLGMLRFAFVFFPLIFFIKKPPIRWSLLAIYGFFISFGQFSFGFFSLKLGAPTGLVALIIQSQAFFTVLIATFLLKEKIKTNQIIAIILAFIALILVGIGQYTGTLPIFALILVLFSAFSWAVGNITIKFIGAVHPLSLVLWGNLSAFICFIITSFSLHGWHDIVQQIQHASWIGWLNVIYLSAVSTLIAYVGWGYLIIKYSANQISPLALFVPIVALIIAWLFLDEPLNSWHWFGIILMMIALMIHMFGDKYKIKSKLNIQ